ncbi:hypothetical protein GCM10027169_06630 [Gordonia jinhuaensis]|uniref:DUF2505 domain-containing protein n=2 Tax=Gordonia jinhuaensis TaxID=1517702 RepID=A0A916SZK1_9ACTN|nr:hypothetical protein GCM10011489_06230 [Gordonia jinhuaensis]
MPIADYWRVLRTSSYWTDLAAGMPTPTSVEEVDIDDGIVDVTLVHTIPEANLPSVVTKIRPGDLLITRTISWRNAVGSLDGEFTATVQGAPASAEGTATVHNSGEGSVEELSGKASVGIPFLGSKIEAMIVENLDELFDSEARVTDEWYTEHRSELAG